MTPRAPGLMPRAAGAVVTVAALWVGTAPAGAADELVGRIQVEQKIRLVARLIADSPASQRITRSGDPQAIANLDEGRVHHALAEDLFARGDWAGARQAADDALRHLSLARRLVPDAPARQAAARLRHEQWLASMERLVEAWRARAGTQPAGDAADLTAAMGLLASSRQQAGEGRYDDANQTLAAAERHVLAGMNRTLQSTTLDYTLRAASPAEEFQQELARHRGLAELLPLALRDLKPRPDVLALIERYGETSGALQAQALQQFQAGEIAQALGHLRNATLYVQRALATAGVAAPQPTGNSP